MPMAHKIDTQLSSRRFCAPALTPSRGDWDGGGLGGYGGGAGGDSGRGGMGGSGGGVGGLGGWSGGMGGEGDTYGYVVHAYFSSVMSAHAVSASSDVHPEGRALAPEL